MRWFVLVALVGCTSGKDPEPTPVDRDRDGSDPPADCDDSDASVHPGSVEVPYDGVDQDCDPATLDDDLDQDGALLVTDCDDRDRSVHPGASEIPYDGVDQDCDPATLDDDLDQDGAAVATDCDDGDPAVHPGAVEVVYDGVDQDCDPATLDDDLDQDGFLLASDCDDADPAVHPDALEVTYDGVDQDCDPTTLDDDLDQDGFQLASDCDDLDPARNPGAVEVCDDGIDQNCDGTAGGCGFWGDEDAADADFVFTGEAVNDSVGEKLAVGDVDGDGLPDLLVAAIYQDDYRGALYLVDPLTGGSMTDARVRWGGATGAVWSGRVMALGDLDGDGVDDIVVGLPQLDRVVRLPDLSTTTQWLDDQPSLATSAPGEAFGAAIALGDRDGDGAVDLATTSILSDDGAADGGSVRLFDGPVADGVTTPDVDLAGVLDGGSVGTAVHLADLDGSGVDDLIVGARSAPGGPVGGGAYYVFHDVASGVGSVADADTILVGEAADDAVTDVSLASGDTDGDGLPDLIIGHPWKDPGTYLFASGAVYLYTALPPGVASLSTATARIDASADEDALGYSLAVAPLDGDDSEDLVVGVPLSNEVLAFVGPLAGAVDPASAAGAVRATGTAAFWELFGSSVGTADLDGDGERDLVVGAPNISQAYPGQVAVVLGRAL